MVGNLIDLEKENTRLREDNKNLREEQKYLLDRIVKLELINPEKENTHKLISLWNRHWKNQVNNLLLLQVRLLH